MTKPLRVDPGLEFGDGSTQLTTAVRAPATAATLTTNNPTVPAGVFQVESDTGLVKVGDGSTAWNSLGYITRSFNGVGNPSSGNLLMPWNLISTATGAPTSGYLTLSPVDVWPAPLTIKALGVNVTTAQVGGTGTLTQAVLYRDNGTGAAPVITSTGLLANVAVTCTSTGIKLTSLPSNITLAPGRYWSGFLYYAGTTAPTTAPQFTYASNGTAIWALSTAFQLNACLRRTGLTAVPTDGVACNPSANTATSVIVGLQAN